MIIKKFKQWINKKINFRINFLIKRFEYICRAESLHNYAMNCSEKGVSDEKYIDKNIIVSLTTYGKRLYDVYLSIESIMRQTMKPNRIILWLGDEFKNADIPITLKKQQERGLEIRYCKDLLSYKKLIPALVAFPSDVIITIDDDVLYFFDLTENLVNAYKKNPELIHCARMHRIKMINSKTPDKYENWTRNYDDSDVSPLNFPVGGGGILYPPRCFPDEVFNEKVFTDICKYADDVWFKAMALLNGVMSKKVFTHNKGGEDYLTNANVQDDSLSRINCGQSMNDTQIKAVFEKYNLFELLSKK